MSYHRGGHPGAVAVSYSTNTMAPLSPSRRYSTSNSSATGSSPSTTGGSSISKYSYRSSGGDRPGSYQSSASTTGYRTNSFVPSTDSYRPFLSPVRSVSSYNETSSIVGSSTVAGTLRYGSASSSSASSTASSTSLCGSRDRNGFQHPTPSSLATSTADFYAKYSPTFYVPNKYGSSSGNTTSIGNGHWRTSSLSSPSGISSCASAELHDNDEYDSCRDHRDRSFSSEASSGIGLFSSPSSSSSSNSNNVGSTRLADRWSARREAKRRTNPVLGSGGTVLTGDEQHDGGPATTEVTLNADNRNNISRLNSSSGCGNRCAAATIPAESAATSSSLSLTTAPVAATSTPHEITDDRNRPTDYHRENDDETCDIRDLDNNNAQKNNNSNNNNNNNNNNSHDHNDDDSILERDNSSLEQHCRRRRGNVEHQPTNDDSNDRNDNNDTKFINNETVVARNNRDINGKINISERTNIIGIGSTSGDSRAVNHHQRRASASADESRGVGSDFVTDVASSDADIPSNILSTVPALTLSSSAHCQSPVSSTCENFASLSAAAVDVSGEDSRGGFIPVDNTKKSLKTSAASSIVTRNDAGGGCSGASFVGGDADHHRNAYPWTKRPTNPDNTERLTNNNGQNDGDAVLGIADAGKIVEPSAETAKTRIRERSTVGSNGTRKSLLWTATNQIEGSFESGQGISEDIENNSVYESSSLGSEIPGIINDNDDEAPGSSKAASRVDNDINNDGDKSHVDIYDFDRDDSAGISVRINGVAERPSRNRSDDPGKPSTSRRNLVGWIDPTIDDVTGASSSAAIASSSTSPGNSAPVAVHQNVYRGHNAQIDDSSNSRPSRNKLPFRGDERYGLNGLRNIGNTCFMNSVIQCLSNTRPLLEYLLNDQHLLDINTTKSSMKGALIKAFGQVIHELWEMSGDHVINTTALKSQIQRFAPRFMGYSQQDAQEFLRYLLEGLHEDVNRVTVKPQPILTDIPDHYADSHKAAESWKRYLRSEDSTIVDVFVGQLRSSLHCTSCDHVSVTLDPFWDLSLPIPARSGTVKLNQCLEHFTKVETMDGDEKPTCSKCQMRRKCTKSFSIQKFPKILVIHLKRFSPTERFRGKLSVLVDFPLTGLDLSAFAAPGVQGCTYNLYGVANHSGTTYSGHYTAYCKHPYSGEWHEYNDNRVSSVPARSVVSSEAYVLFYEQQSPSPHL